MKNKLSIIILILWPLVLIGQNYYPLLEKNKTWNILLNEYRTYAIKLGKDTIINDNEYYQLISLDDSAYSQNHLTNLHLLDCYMREDTTSKKVYIIEYSPSEKLIYDFNITKDDTVSIEYMCNFTFKVDSVDYVIVNNTQRKRYYLSGLTPGSNETWIEGIGSLSGIEKSWHYPCSADMFYSLLCVEYNDNLIYKNPSYNTCYINRLSNEPMNHRSNIEICPNPAKDFILIKNISRTSKLIILNSLGQKIYKKDLIKDINLIQIEKLKSGLYLIIVCEENLNSCIIEKLIIE
jgi:hypothetical protein